mmetsp:Transcript_19430/g.40551  ORF Transcript_19430/g.40551 Transcript_19430/m.40551 type:complete len:261 (+) Transcript_19430:41-823(+)|eukprot:CAMPEP_0118648506 /NCGR_PEP_ID=MMETSP0785-20121206/9193_1 /TAXON_ID=91992 /ORGANISM="Bolidomonas pacifica, Strain CCMP 1866" /LENGTH=260 /DNA_ID=CAMNT_0006540705 /DNA_START=37 /DNA_END=822 /DNA_ORIENTATION=+
MSSFKIYQDSPDPELENIYNLIPRTKTTVSRAPMYRSKHNPLKPIKYSTLKENGPSLGKKDFSLPNPQKFLRASTPSKRNPLKPIENVKKFSYKKVIPSKPKVPSKDERPVMSLHTEKNFITANAVEAILTVPQQPEVKEAPDYLKKEDFGKVPGYLAKVKDEIKQENELIDQFVAKQMMSYEDAPELCDEMPEAERLELIEKLKTKWDAVNKKYQVLCMHTMFEGHSKMKKENFEKELNGIEADLQKLTTNGPVLVSHS